MQLYEKNIKSPIRHSSVALIVQGTFFLWICFLFYNISPTDGITKIKKMEHEPAVIVMNTIISSASACIGLVFLRPLFISKSDPTNKYPV